MKINNTQKELFKGIKSLNVREVMMMNSLYKYYKEKINEEISIKISEEIKESQKLDKDLTEEEIKNRVRDLTEEEIKNRVRHLTEEEIKNTLKNLTKKVKVIDYPNKYFVDEPMYDPPFIDIIVDDNFFGKFKAYYDLRHMIDNKVVVKINKEIEKLENERKTSSGIYNFFSKLFNFGTHKKIEQYKKDLSRIKKDEAVFNDEKFKIIKDQVDLEQFVGDNKEANFVPIDNKIQKYEEYMTIRKNRYDGFTLGMPFLGFNYETLKGLDTSENYVIMNKKEFDNTFPNENAVNTLKANKEAYRDDNTFIKPNEDPVNTLKANKEAYRESKGLCIIQSSKLDELYECQIFNKQKKGIKSH